MSGKFAAEAYRAYVADTASELELKSIDISGMTPDEIYHQMVLLIPYFISRKLDCCLILEGTNEDGATVYTRIILDGNNVSDGMVTIFGRLDLVFTTDGDITSFAVMLDENEASAFSTYTQALILQLTASFTFVKIWYR